MSIYVGGAWGLNFMCESDVDNFMKLCSVGSNIVTENGTVLVDVIRRLPYPLLGPLNSAAICPPPSQPQLLHR